MAETFPTLLPLRGALNFVEALTESCDTWFYQVGIKTGAEPIIDWALRLGFGAK